MCINNTLLREICPNLTRADKPLTINSRKLAFSTAPFEAADLVHSVIRFRDIPFYLPAHKTIIKNKCLQLTVNNHDRCTIKPIKFHRFNIL